MLKPINIDQRLNNLQIWTASTLNQVLNLAGIMPNNIELFPVSGDASFRRYFRVQFDKTSYIAVDAPPDKENNQGFVTIASSLHQHGVNTPIVHAVNYHDGFLLLNDLGNNLYLDTLQQYLRNDDKIDNLYKKAIDSLLLIQSCPRIENYQLPSYNEKLLKQEMALFQHWFAEKLLGIQLTQNEHQLLDQSVSLLVDKALEQPLVCVHRDYHSRNLMITPGNTPGVLDFQDAVIGPISYDLVSLLRDCYITWPDSKVNAWVQYYLDHAKNHGLIDNKHVSHFQQWFDLMGIQRHLKAIGIFARLHLRDNKSNYLADIPRTFSYIAKVAPKYPELAEFYTWLKDSIQPHMAEWPVLTKTLTVCGNPSL